jgi:GNAT superfamily N-acetyltransferase
VVPSPTMTAERYTFRTAYWADPAARAEFKRFLVEIHGLDLTEWETAGYWDQENYRPFSLFDGDRIVSHLCLYSMDLVVDGRPCRVGQFSGVGTAASHRRQGLGRWLTVRALDWAAPTHDGFFLLSSEGAVEFYRNSGFTAAEESVDVLRAQCPPARAGLVALDPDSSEDRDRVFELASQRCAVSDVLGSLNARLLMFHWLYGLRDCAFWIEELAVVVFASWRGGRLTVHDVVGRSVPRFDDLHPFLAGTPHDEVEFLFPTDLLHIEPTASRRLEDNLTHVMAPFALPGRGVALPCTCHA